MLSRSLLRKLTPEILKRALEERKRLVKLERLTNRRDMLERALADINKEMSRLNGQPEGIKAPKASRKRRRRFSAETRKRMAIAQRARWAKVRGKVETATG